MLHVVDEAIPPMIHMMGQSAADLIDAALAGDGIVARPIAIRQVRYTPGSTLVVQYDASVLWANGRHSKETFVAASQRRLPTGVALIDIDGSSVGIWRVPDDPGLPGLAKAMDRDSVLGIFESLSIETDNVTLSRRAYRPLRRAVIEARTPEATLYLKVVRPSRVEDLQTRHTSLSAALPVPRSHGWNRKLGIVVLAEQPGLTLRRTLQDSDGGLPDVGEIVGLLDALPSPPAVPAPVNGPAQRATEFAKLLRAVVPSEVDRIDAIVNACEVAAPGLSQESVPVHGDFHSSQILVGEGHVSGLVDVDSAGEGHRIHDLAQLLAHLAVLGAESPTARFDEYGAELIGAFDRMVDPAALRLNVAGSILGFATGPFRVQEASWPQKTSARIDLAERWVASAEARD